MEVGKKKHNTNCCVPQCYSKAIREPYLSFHRFPRENDRMCSLNSRGEKIYLDRRREWIRILKIGKPITKNMLVCSKHFRKEDFFPNTEGVARIKNNLKKNAIPSVCLPIPLFPNQSKVKTKTHLTSRKTEVHNEHEKERTMGLNSSPAKVWKKDETAALIALYESERYLYDKGESDHYDIVKRNKAYQRIRQVMLRIRPDCTVSHIKNRIKYLRSQYNAELLRKDLAIQSGSCTEETYMPSLWCFGLLQFLDEHLQVEQTVIKTEQAEEENTKDAVPENNESTGHLVTNSETNDLHHHKDENSSVNMPLEINDDDPDEVSDRGSKNKKQKLNDGTSLGVEENTSASCSWEREDIFGQYVATEMKALRDNPLLYLQTKQAILEILTSANFELINPE